MVHAFVKELFHIHPRIQVPRVAPVAPFRACFNTSKLGSTQMEAMDRVPPFDLVLQNESVYWRVFGPNYLVPVKKDVFCLGFVDGGVRPRTSIMIYWWASIGG